MGLLSEDDLDYYLAQLGAYFAIMLRDNPDDTYKELYSHYDAVREHIQTLEKTNGWISVKDRLPEEKENWITMDYQQVICCCDFGGDPRRIDVRTYGFGKGHFWHGPQIMDGVVTHWMPIPEPPKEETHNGIARND